MIQAQSVTQEVGSLIDKMAAKLAVPAAHLWEVLSRQARSEAVYDVGVAVIWVGIAVAVGYGVSLAVRKCDAMQADFSARYADYQQDKKTNVYATAPTNPDADSTALGFRVARFVVVGFCLIVAANYGIVAWQHVANPEYYALHEVLNVLKGK